MHSNAAHLLSVVMHAFERLAVWQKAHQLTLRIYGVTATMTATRFASLPSQMRRASASVAANIAEGSGFDAPDQFARYLELALASAHELQYHVRLAADLGAIDVGERAKLEARADEVARMLVGLRKRVRNATASPRDRGRKGTRRGTIESDRK